MTDLPTLYNSLPSIQDAHDSFEKAGGKTIIDKLITLTAKYDNKFGVCLVHAHTKLEPGEVMLSTPDGISQPVHEPEEKYPERWLITGEAYEFSSTPPATTPPQEYFKEFKQIIGDIDFLGVFAVDPTATGPQTEWTEGRKSRTRPGPPGDSPGIVAFPSGWVPGTNIVVKWCFICTGGDCMS